MKKLIFLLLIFMLVLSLTVTVYADDDAVESTENEESKTDGELLYDLGIINGSGLGQLNEDQAITRAELISIVVRLLDPTSENEDYIAPSIPTFSDVPLTHWAYKNIELAVANELTTGIGDGMFGVDNLVTYNEALLFLLRSLDYDTSEIEFTSAAAIIATDYGLHLEDSMDGTEILERGEFFELLAKTLDSDIFGVKIKKLYRLAFDENKMEAFLNGRGQTKDYKTGEVRDLRLLDNYLGQLRRFMERLDEIEADDVDELLETIDLDDVSTKEETRMYMNQIQKLFVVHKINDNGNKPDDNGNKPDDEIDNMINFDVLETDLDENDSEMIADGNESLATDIAMFFNQIEKMAKFKVTYLSNNEYSTIAYPSFIRVLEKLNLRYTAISIVQENDDYMSEKYDLSYSFMKKDHYDVTVTNDMGFTTMQGNVLEVRKYKMVDDFYVYAIIIDESNMVYNSETEENEEITVKRYVAFTVKNDMAYEIIADNMYGKGYKNMME